MHNIYTFFKIHIFLYGLMSYISANDALTALHQHNENIEYLFHSKTGFVVATVS